MTLHAPTTQPVLAPASVEAAVVQGHCIVKRFGTGASAVEALRGVDVAFPADVVRAADRAMYAAKAAGRSRVPAARLEP